MPSSGFGQILGRKPHPSCLLYHLALQKRGCFAFLGTRARTQWASGRRPSHPSGEGDGLGEQRNDAFYSGTQHKLLRCLKFYIKPKRCPTFYLDYPRTQGEGHSFSPTTPCLPACPAFLCCCCRDLSLSPPSPNPTLPCLSSKICTVPTTTLFLFGLFPSYWKSFYFSLSLIRFFREAQPP